MVLVVVCSFPYIIRLGSYTGSVNYSVKSFSGNCKTLPELNRFLKIGISPLPGEFIYLLRSVKRYFYIIKMVKHLKTFALGV